MIKEGVQSFRQARLLSWSEMKNSLLFQSAAFYHLTDGFRHLHADVRESLSGLVLVAEDVFVEPFQLVDRLAFYDRGVIDIGKVSGRAAEGVEEVNLFVWLEVHGEEAVLRRAIGAALGRCAEAGKNIAFDVREFGELGYNFSYLESVLTDVVCEEGRTSADMIHRAVFYNVMVDMDKAEAFEMKVSRPYKEEANLSFIARGDMLSAKLKSYLSAHEPIPFGTYLMSLSEKKGIHTRSQICMVSGISRYTMSKVINGISRPSKDSLAALAIGLKLTLQEAEELCNQVGYHLGDMDLVDRAVRFFIGEKIYDIDMVNYCLYSLGIEPLGEKPRDIAIDRYVDIE